MIDFEHDNHWRCPSCGDRFHIAEVYPELRLFGLDPRQIAWLRKEWLKEQYLKGLKPD